jgi:hypothetical protein
MRTQLPMRSFSFPMSKCTIALLCSVFGVEPLFAQELDWPYYGADVYNTRFANLDQINPSNVAQLKPAWIFHTGVSDPNMSMEMTPLVVAGVMYVTTGDDDVFAVNATTGKQVWHYHPSDMPKISTLGPGAYTQANRGVAYGSGLIFVGRIDAKLVALNGKTGAVVWEATVDLPSTAAMTLAPQFIRASEGTVPEVIVGITTNTFMSTPTTRPRGSSSGVSGPLSPTRGPVTRTFTVERRFGGPPPSIRPSIWCTSAPVSPTLTLGPAIERERTYTRPAS